MEEQPTSKPAFQELLQGTKDPSDFLAELLAQDQSTPERTASFANVEVLTRPDVASFFNERPEYCFEYHNLLSLSFFHRGQIEALDHLDLTAARESFAHALEEAQRADALPDAFEGSVEWTEYVEGTLAFLENDLPRLSAARDRLASRSDTSERNVQILDNFKRQLESGGAIDYRVGYAS